MGTCFYVSPGTEFLWSSTVRLPRERHVTWTFCLHSIILPVSPSFMRMFPRLDFTQSITSLTYQTCTCQFYRKDVCASFYWRIILTATFYSSQALWRSCHAHPQINESDPPFISVCRPACCWRGNTYPFFWIRIPCKSSPSKASCCCRIWRILSYITDFGQIRPWPASTPIHYLFSLSIHGTNSSIRRIDMNSCQPLHVIESFWTSKTTISQA